MAQAVAFLDAHATDFMQQPGGSRNFGGGIIETDRLTPLYTAQELRRVFDRVHDPTATTTGRTRIASSSIARSPSASRGERYELSK